MLTIRGADTPEGRASTRTDGSGAYVLPPVEAAFGSDALLTLSFEGYRDAAQLVSTTREAGGIITRSFVLRRSVLLVDQLDVLLTRDDPDYGSDEDKALGLPGRRGPVKVIVLNPPTSGWLEVTATWPGPDPLNMWVEKTYVEESMEAASNPVHNVLTLRLPPGWANDPLNVPILTVGLRGPHGLLSGPTPIHLSLTPTN